MLHYRAVVNEPNLRDTLLVQDAYLRYGNACSDVSGELAQDTTAIWAGVASRGIKQLVATSSPALHIYCSKPDGSTALFAQQVTALVSVRLDGWTIHLDSWLIAKIGSLRENFQMKQAESSSGTSTLTIASARSSTSFHHNLTASNGQRPTFGAAPGSLRR
jgi:hypothetical protein